MTLDKIIPIASAIVVYLSRAALGIAIGASLVMLALVAARLLGYPMRDHTFGDTAFGVWLGAAAVYVACLCFARFVDWKRGF